MQDIFLLLVGFWLWGVSSLLFLLFLTLHLMYDHHICYHCLIVDKDEQKRGIEILGRRQVDVQTG